MEYIEREAAIAETRKPRLTDAELRRRLANIPAADVVPVVRCAVCANCEKVDDYEMWCAGRGFPKVLTTADGYCSQGRKK